MSVTGFGSREKQEDGGEEEVYEIPSTNEWLSGDDAVDESSWVTGTKRTGERKREERKSEANERGSRAKEPNREAKQPLP